MCKNINIIFQSLAFILYNSLFFLPKLACYCRNIWLYPK